MFCEKIFKIDVLTILDMGGELKEPPPQKRLKMPNFGSIWTPMMSKNFFEVIQSFWKNSKFWVILESLSHLKTFFDLFTSCDPPFPWPKWVTISFEPKNVLKECLTRGGAQRAPPHVKSTVYYLMSCMVNSFTENIPVIYIFIMTIDGDDSKCHRRALENG